MAQPCQLHDPNPVPRLLGLDGDVGLAADRTCEILVETQPPARNRGVTTDVFFGVGFVSLGLVVVEENIRGQHAMELCVFDAEFRVGGLHAVKDLLFLDTCGVLTTVIVSK